ncbi:MAG: ABC transporter substrate-binding protein, partial [Candidatus Dormibacteraeota bacterium]|nr:ABC transporter substrate-binding protein [Candidatus Dormibacteraeota bacterium]
MSSARDEGFDRFEGFEKFLDEWSRRDFLRRSGGAAALTLFMAGGLEAVLAACGNTPGAQNQNVKKGGHVVEADFSDPTNFNPIFVSDTSSQVPSGMMFSGLLDADADGKKLPAIAKSVPKPSSDGLTYKFDLRQDAKWSDGHPITADDVVFTYALMAGPTYNYKAINSRYWPDLEIYLDSVTAVDKYTVVVKTKTPYAPFLDSYTFAPLPKHILDPIAQKSPGDFKKADFNFGPTVVSGPMTFSKWDKTQQVVLTANDKHFLGRPNLDSWVIKNVGSQDAGVNQLKTGEVDVASVPSALWEDLATSADKINRVSFVQASYDYFGFNMDPSNPKRPASGKIFSDKAVREALYYAVDRQKLADKVYFKQAVVATSVEPKTSWALTDQVRKYPFDAKKAAEMLDGAGWKPGADGIRTKDGVRFSFELITNVGNKARESTIQVLSESWRQIGVEAKAKPIQFTEYVKTSTTRDFDMVMGGISAGVDPDLSQ